MTKKNRLTLRPEDDQKKKLTLSPRMTEGEKVERDDGLKFVFLCYGEDV